MTLNMPLQSGQTAAAAPPESDDDDAVYEVGDGTVVRLSEMRQLPVPVLLALIEKEQLMGEFRHVEAAVARDVEALMRRRIRRAEVVLAEAGLPAAERGALLAELASCRRSLTEHGERAAMLERALAGTLGANAGRVAVLRGLIAERAGEEGAEVISSGH